MTIGSEALQKLLGMLERESGQIGVSDLEKQAARKAETDAALNAPNFETVGPPRTEVAPGAQNFQLQGEPYSGNVPTQYQTPIPKDLSLPEVKTPEIVNSPIETSVRDVTPKVGNAPPEKVNEFLSKYGKGLGVAGGAGAAALTLNQDKGAMSNGGGAPPKGPVMGLEDLPFLQPPGQGQPPVPLRGTDVSYPEQTKSKEEQPEEDNTSEEQPGASAKNEAVASTVSNKPSETPKESDLQSLANMLGSDTEATKTNLQEAQKNRDRSILANQLGKAGELIGSSISRTSPIAQGLFDQNIQLAGQGVTDLKERIALEAQDPGSAVSANYRKFLERYGVKVPDNVSAEQIKSTLLPAAEKEQLAKERLSSAKDLKQMQLAMLKQKQDETSDWKQLARDDRLDKHTTDRIDKANKLLTGELASSRSAFGRAANTHQAAEKMEALVSNIDPNDLDKRQITEIARSLDSMLSSGQPTISGMKKLIPSSAAGDVSTISEYINNIPKGAQQGEFVKRLMSTVEREKALAKDQMGRTQGKLLGSYSDLKDNQTFKAMLNQQGIPLDIFQNSATQVSKKQESSGIVLMSKDGVNFKPIPANRVEEARAHGYKER